MLLKWFLTRQIDAFEREYSYDMGYARELLDADPAALLAFWKTMAISRYHKDIPRDPMYAAKLAGTIHEDCGPCTQLVADMAARAGVPSEILRAVVAGDVAAMPEDVALAYRFARASLDRDPEADDLRQQAVARWGRRGLATLALSVTAARMFPTLKSALGHAQACTRVRVAGEFVRPITAEIH